MKQKIIPLLLALLMVGTVIISGCGSSTRNYSSAPQAAAEEYGYDYDYNEAISMDGEMDVGSQTAPSLSDRKIIKNVYLSLETQEFDTAITEITALVERLGGDIEYSDVSGTSLYDRGEYSTRYASFTARIPVEKLTAATDELGQLCNVSNRSESINDITDNYYDVDGRLKSLRTQEERLLSMMETATQLEDMITIESALADVRYQIESLTGQMQRMDSQVSYSTLSIDLSEVVEYSELRNQPKNFGERIAEAFTNSLDFIKDFGQSIILFVVAAGPFALVYGGIILIVILIVRIIVKSSRKRRAAKYAAMGMEPPVKGQPWAPYNRGAVPPVHPYQPTPQQTPVNEESKDEKPTE